LANPVPAAGSRVGDGALPPGVSDRVPVVLERGQCFDGLLSFGDSARVDGELHGEIVARGTLWVGAEAHVRARIEVGEAIVAGCIEGDITARRRIELLPTARVRGRLQAPRVALADGCLVHGRCLTGGLPGPTAELPQAPRESVPASP
jgi:cytoskeletal protein CcmA (bactofilin family)